MNSNDEALKAESWDEFIGQKKLKRRLSVHIAASLKQVRPMEHVLLTAPAGSGKTTLAELIARELGDPLTTIVLGQGTNRNTLLHKLKIPNFTGGVLFLDEVHALSTKDQEIFLPVLSRGVLVDRGRDLLLPWLTVIAATTERDKLIDPFIERFIIAHEFEEYSTDEMAEIVSRMAQKANVELSDELSAKLGNAAGGNPRGAEKLVFAARALQVVDEGPVTAEAVLGLCAVDTDGINELQMRMLRFIHSQGGKSGANAIAAHLQIPIGLIPKLERLPMNHGLLIRTPSGRELTPLGEARCRGKKVEVYER